MHNTRLNKLIRCLVVAALTLPSASHADKPESDPVPTASAAQGAQRYVLASRLNLRDAPGGRKVGRLSINSPVEVLEERGPDVSVRTKNEAEGWVPAQFLGDKPVTLPDAIAAAQSAETAEERLSWAQRAAAIDARHRQALEVLAGAYRAVNDELSAKAIDQRLVWPDDILLAGYAPRGRAEGQIALEWGVTELIHFTDHDDDGYATILEGNFEGEDCDDENPTVYPERVDDLKGDGVDQDCDGTDGPSDTPSPTGIFDASLKSSGAVGLGGADAMGMGLAPPEGFILTPSEMKKRGVRLGSVVWVLPDRSAAVKGTVAGMRLSGGSECDNSWLWVLDVEVALPEGERPVAYTIKPPPRAWKEPAPARDFEAARAAVRKEAGPQFTELHAVADGHGVTVRAVRDDLPPPKETDAVHYTLHDYHVGADGSASLKRSWVFDDWMSTYDVLWVGRDLNGDGHLERVDISFCSHILTDTHGTLLDQSVLRCCGC
jgi:hypothetical protein